VMRQAIQVWKELAGDFPRMPGHRHSLAIGWLNLVGRQSSIDR
jgi:hypothetical protein